MRGTLAAAGCAGLVWVIGCPLELLGLAAGACALAYAMAEVFFVEAAGR